MLLFLRHQNKMSMVRWKTISMSPIQKKYIYRAAETKSFRVNVARAELFSCVLTRRCCSFLRHQIAMSIVYVLMDRQFRCPRCKKNNIVFVNCGQSWTFLLCFNEKELLFFLDIKLQCLCSDGQTVSMPPMQKKIYIVLWRRYLFG